MKVAPNISILVLLQLCTTVIASTDFGACLDNLRSGAFGSVDGVLDSHGNKVVDVSQATGLTYQACKTLCGSGNASFDWRAFSDQLSAWLLPWLALVSQLPFGANDTFKNFETMIMAVGSPMLAAYSLALSVTSNRWMVERFRRSDFRNNYLAAKIMGNLQQVLITLPEEEHVLPSLIVLQENDVWWKTLADKLDYLDSQWTLAAIMSMVYVALSYILTWINTLTSSANSQAYPNGQSLGSLWLSLLPIVTCNLQLSPKCDISRITGAIEDADKSYWVVADPPEPDKDKGKPQPERGQGHTIIIQKARRDMVDEDMICPTPIFFCWRFAEWFRAVLKVTDAFDAASKRVFKAGTKEPVCRGDVISYCELEGDRDDTYYYDLVNIYVKSVLLAFLLQWGTAGAAFMAMYLTPTQGVGCRAGAQLVFLCLSTLVWLFTVLSGVFFHSYTVSQKNTKIRIFIGWLAIILRQIAKTLAGLNTLWILVSSFFQISNMENNCYCKANVLGRGKDAYALLVYPPDEWPTIKSYWIGGIVMASAAAFIFVVAVNILMKQPQPRAGSEMNDGHRIR